MKLILDLSFGILVFFILSITGSKGVCTLPNFPAEGGYNPRRNKYLPGDNVTYFCTDPIYNRLVGTEINTCGLNGEWSEPSPFCDQIGVLKNAFISYGTLDKRQPIPTVIDFDINTCFTLEPGAILEVQLEKAAVYRIWLHIKKGSSINIDAYTGDFIKLINLLPSETDWYMWRTDQGVLSDSVAFDYRSNEPTTICEIRFDVNVAGCANPPRSKIDHGYFKVSRNITTLICEDGYKSGSSEFVCEGNEWKVDGLQCEGEGEPKVFTIATIAGIASGAFIVAVSLIVITIFCLRKKRRNKEETIEVHRPSKAISEDDSVSMHLYEAMNYYEPMQRNAPTNRAPAGALPTDDYCPYFLP